MRRVLKVGFVKECVHSAYPDMLDVGYNAHDLTWTLFVHAIRFVAQKQLLADRIFLREIAVCHALVNNYRPGRALRVALVQVTSFLERNPHGAKEAGAHFVKSQVGPVLQRQSRLPNNRKTYGYRSEGGKYGD